MSKNSACPYSSIPISPLLARPGILLQNHHGRTCVPSHHLATEAEVILFELVKVMIVLLADAERSVPLEGHPVWHVVLYKLLDDNVLTLDDYPEGISANWDGPFPKVVEVLNCFSGLKDAHFLWASSPRYREYNVSAQALEDWRKMAMGLINGGHAEALAEVQRRLFAYLNETPGLQ